MFYKMKKTLLTALLFATIVGANAQDTSAWTVDQDVTDQLAWTDYDCTSNDNGGWQTKGENVDLWTSPCFELYNNNGTNEAGTEVFQVFYLPAGVYNFTVNGFYRHTGNGYSTLEEIQNGNIVRGAELFCEVDVTEAGELQSSSIKFTKALADFSSTLSDQSYWSRTEEWWDDGDGVWQENWYYPQCQGGCVPRFEEGYCLNELKVVQPVDGFVRIGIRKTVTNANNTVDFAFFKAYWQGEASDEVDLLLAMEEFNNALEQAEADYLGNKLVGRDALFSLFDSDLNATFMQYNNSETAEGYRKGVAAVQALCERYDTYIESYDKLSALIRLAKGVADSPAMQYPGIDDYRDAVTQAENVLNDIEGTYVTSADAYVTALTNLQQARVDYAMSQEQKANGAWDFTSLVAYPFFVNMESNPTYTDGRWYFPDQVNTDQVTINKGEYWYDTDGSGWRHYGLENRDGLYCANHWGQKWGEMALVQDIADLPNGYYSMSALGRPGHQHNAESMWIELSSSSDSQRTGTLPPEGGFWEGWGYWTSLSTDLVEVTDGRVRVACWDEADNHIAWTGIQLFYYGAEPDYSLIIQPLIDAVRADAAFMQLGGDKLAVEQLLAQIPATITSLDGYYAAKEIIAQAAEYIVVANDYVANHDITNLYAELADQYFDNIPFNNAIDVALFASFDVYDNPEATYHDIETMFADYEAYVHYFQVVTDYEANSPSEAMQAKIDEQLAALADEDTGYSDAARLADYERQLAGIANREIFDNMDLASASEDNPIDFTEFIKNPTFAEGNAYWTGNATVDPVLATAEAYDTNFEIAQTLYAMPAGTYRLYMKGFYRDGTLTQAIEHEWAGSEGGYVPNFELFANTAAESVVSIANENAMFTERTFTEYTYDEIDPETSQPIQLRVWLEDVEETDDQGNVSIVTHYWRQAYNSEDQLADIDDSNNSWVYDQPFDAGFETLYFPNSMRGSALRLANDDGAYDNYVTVTLNHDGDLRIGCRKDVTIVSDWCAFDDFRLYYIGAPDPDAIHTPAIADGQVKEVYAADGRRLPRLQRGINIVRMSDGSVRKVLVK